MNLKLTGLALVAVLSASGAWANETQNPWACAPQQREPATQQEQVSVLEQCARQGNAAAMFVLANRMPDKQNARIWLLRAAELDHAESLYQLGLEEKDPRLAAQYMKASAHALKHRHVAQ